MKRGHSFADGKTNLSIPGCTVIPVVEYPDVRVAAAWLCRVFGFRERVRIGSHRIQLSIGSGAVVVAETKLSVHVPLHGGHSIMVRVRDADEHYWVARRAGAKILSQPASHPYGERQYSVEDLVGHVWVFSQTIKNVEPAAWGGELVADEADTSA